MGKIFCIMGKSCSGKDTMFKMLVNDPELNIKPIIPYTTRPIRANEINGENYIFIDEQQLNQFQDSDKIIESRSYSTTKGIWYYCTIDDGQIDLVDKNYMIIATLEAYMNMSSYFCPEVVIPIYINIDDAERLLRAINRERNQLNPDYAEVCRRFLADSHDFSNDKLVANNITQQYYNNDVTECYKKIKRDIISMIS